MDSEYHSFALEKTEITMNIMLQKQESFCNSFSCVL